MSPGQIFVARYGWEFGSQETVLVGYASGMFGIGKKKKNKRKYTVKMKKLKFCTDLFKL